MDNLAIMLPDEGIDRSEDSNGNLGNISYDFFDGIGNIKLGVGFKHAK